jgi:hypothetical protein|tara:strand:+ start:631 stop:840 length:210 start_codon:yes stop_codon:yes gene_type:complete
MEFDELRDSFDLLHKQITALLFYCQQTYEKDSELNLLLHRVREPLDDLYAHYWQLDLDMIPKDEDETLN